MTYFVAAAIAATGAVVGGAVSASASRKAASLQADAANRATDIQSQQYNRTEELNEPYRQAGVGALNKLIGASDYTKFGMDQFQADPGYAFRLGEGQKAIERSASARGLQLSGSTLKGLTNYAQGAASQEYQNAFNRYQAERSALLNPLQTLAGIGQSATSQVGAAGQNYANTASDLTTSGAAARASGYVGSSNALNQAIGGASNAYMSGQVMNRFMPQRSSSYGQPMVDPSTYYTPAQYSYQGIE
jgi:hypothetical protein